MCSLCRSEGVLPQKKLQRLRRRHYPGYVPGLSARSLLTGFSREVEDCFLSFKASRIAILSKLRMFSLALLILTCWKCQFDFVPSLHAALFYGPSFVMAYHKRSPRLAELAMFLIGMVSALLMYGYSLGLHMAPTHALLLENDGLALFWVLNAILCQLRTPFVLVTRAAVCLASGRLLFVMGASNVLWRVLYMNAIPAFVGIGFDALHRATFLQELRRSTECCSEPQTSQPAVPLATPPSLQRLENKHRVSSSKALNSEGLQGSLSTVSDNGKNPNATCFPTSDESKSDSFENKCNLDSMERNKVCAPNDSAHPSYKASCESSTAVGQHCRRAVSRLDHSRQASLVAIQASLVSCDNIKVNIVLPWADPQDVPIGALENVKGQLMSRHPMLHVSSAMLRKGSLILTMDVSCPGGDIPQAHLLQQLLAQLPVEDWVAWLQAPSPQDGQLISVQVGEELLELEWDAAAESWVQSSSGPRILSFCSSADPPTPAARSSQYFSEEVWIQDRQKEHQGLSLTHVAVVVSGGKACVGVSLPKGVNLPAHQSSSFEDGVTMLRARCAGHQLPLAWSSAPTRACGAAMLALELDLPEVAEAVLPSLVVLEMWDGHCLLACSELLVVPSNMAGIVDELRSMGDCLQTGTSRMDTALALGRWFEYLAMLEKENATSSSMASKHCSSMQDSGITLLSGALSRGWTTTSRLLLKGLVDALGLHFPQVCKMVEDSNANSMLHLAIISMALPTVQMVVQMGIDQGHPFTWWEENPEGATPLHLLAYQDPSGTKLLSHLLRLIPEVQGAWQKAQGGLHVTPSQVASHLLAVGNNTTSQEAGSSCDPVVVKGQKMTEAPNKFPAVLAQRRKAPAGTSAAAAGAAPWKEDPPLAPAQEWPSDTSQHRSSNMQLSWALMQMQNVWSSLTDSETELTFHGWETKNPVFVVGFNFLRLAGSCSGLLRTWHAAHPFQVLLGVLLFLSNLYLAAPFPSKRFTRTAYSMNKISFHSSGIWMDCLPLISKVLVSLFRLSPYVFNFFYQVDSRHRLHTFCLAFFVGFFALWLRGSPWKSATEAIAIMIGSYIIETVCVNRARNMVPQSHKLE